eukprot:jgi/Chrzof1/6755/Cz19g08060.t1
MDYMSRYKANNIYTCLVTRRSSCAELTIVDTVDNGCKPHANSRTSAYPQSAPKVICKVHSIAKALGVNRTADRQLYELVIEV